MSSITKCLNTSTICRKVARCAKKLCAVLIEADIFNKAVQGNIPKPLRNLYTKFDVNTLRLCGEMAWVEEHLHTIGNSDIATVSSITKCLNTSTICRKVARCAKKLCAVLIEADIFNKAVQGNIPKPLRNLYTKFDVNTLRLCGEMAWVEEHLHTIGNSDIAM